MRVLILLTISLFSLNGYAQLLSNIPEIQVSENNTDVTYVIGIGNLDLSAYNDVLNYLENDVATQVYATCNMHRIIGFRVLNNGYKSYDVIRDHLLNTFNDLLLLRKDDAIFTKDCSDEILKQ